LRPKTAADEGRDDPDLPLAQAQHRGEPVAQEHRRLRGVPYRELIGAGVPAGDDAAGLDRRRRAMVVRKTPGDDVAGLGAGARIIASTLSNMRCDIVADVVMNRSVIADDGLF